MNVLEQVWMDRSTINSEGKRVPTFWEPRPIKEFSIEDPGFDAGLISRIVALGLNLELEVSDLLDQQIKRIRGLQTGLANKVLRAAQSDEARHHKAFTMAKEALQEKGISIPVETAESFAKELDNLPYHPITIAALLEVTLFLPGLAMLRLYGGRAFFDIAVGINSDEQRHTKVNASLAHAIGEPISTCTKFLQLRDSVLDFLDCPEVFRKASDELFTDLDSPTLNSLGRASSAVFIAPFENSNAAVYSRTTAQ